MDTKLKWLVSKSVDIIWAILLFLLGILHRRFDLAFLDKIFPGMTKQEYQQLLLILSMSFVLTLAYVIYLWFIQFNKIDIDEYDQKDGYYVDKHTGNKYCPKCLPENIKSRLDFNYMAPKCHKCNTSVGF